MFSITAPASSRAFLTLAEIKSAVGEAGTSNDAALTALGDQIADAIAIHCDVASDGVTPPTLLRETLVETVRRTSHFNAWGFPHPGQRLGSTPIDDRADDLLLSRRFVFSVTSVVIDGETLDPALYEVDRSAGLLRRLSENGAYICWPYGVSVVTYVAGFTDAPSPLKLASTLLVREAWSIMQADPLVRAETFEGLGSVQYGLGSLMSQNGGMPPGVAGLLEPYRTRRA